MKSRLIRYVLALGLVITSQALYARPAQQQSNTATVGELIRMSKTSQGIGMVVADAKTGTVLFQHNNHRLFTPASNTKLFTAAAALFQLGPEYRFRTTLLWRPEQQLHNTLQGNLTLVFRGDPSLTITDLQQLLAQIKQKGITHIRGDFVIDNKRFQEPNYAPGWTEDNMDWYYAAPVNSAILNQNFIPLKLDVQNGRVAISGEGSEYMPINNYLTVGSSKSKEKGKGKKKRRCAVSYTMDSMNRIEFSGCLPANSKGAGLKVAIKNPDQFAEQVVKQTLQAQGITIEGHVISATGDMSLPVLAEHASAPLSELLKPVLQDSDNLYAESIAKTLGREYLQRGTFQDGVQAIRAILQKHANLNLEQSEFFDGSGLSHYNQVTPDHIVRLLYAMYHADPRVAQAFMAALPYSGREGTLKRRMAQKDLLDRIQAKTGTLDGASSLSGYVTTHDDRKLIFSILINQNRRVIAPKQFENKLCGLLIKQKF